MGGREGGAVVVGLGGEEWLALAAIMGVMVSDSAMLGVVLVGALVATLVVRSCRGGGGIILQQSCSFGPAGVISRRLEN